MSSPDSPRLRRIRSDGWTADRQSIFLCALAERGDVGRAAAAAGMSREGVYRLRKRDEHGLFAALWDRAPAPPPTTREVHSNDLTDGRLMRLLGNHFRRESGGFARIGTRHQTSADE